MKITARQTMQYFTPLIPNIVCLGDDVFADGIFTITTDKSTGRICGVY
ncbi:MAG TPA: hypothetical protein PK665_06615 [Ignavibacteriaceae bacterium]|nr:hypothetical protein [Ignavibacteriaceae bacterium]